MTRSVTALLAVLGVAATTAAAQAAAPAAGPESRFRITPNLGVMRFDRTSALSSTDEGLSQLWASAGLSASYDVTPQARVGIYLEYQRPTTSPDYYPYALFRTGNDYQLYAVSQIVSVLQYGIDGAYTLPVLPRLGPYVKGGVGRHAVYPDVQASNSTEHINGTHFLLGAGFNYAATGNIGVRFELLDFMWSDWDRDDLNPVDPAFQNTVFPEDNPPGVLWEKPGIIHNLRLALGVTFTPGGAR